MTEIVRYAIVNESGDIEVFCLSEETALTSRHNKTGRSIVKLVGQMPEPKKMKKVALFAYCNNEGEFIVRDYLRTEEDAKAQCKEAEYTLIKWPFGDVIEVEE
jgi:hypothetical protein